MREVLAFAERLLRHPVRLVDRLLREFVAKAVLVDRDQAEAARRERIAEHGVDARAHARRTAGDFAQHEVARLGVLQVADEQLAPLLLVDRRQPEALALRLTTPSTSSAERCELLQRVGDEALALLLGPREHAVADARAPPRRPRSIIRSCGGVSACHCSGTAQTWPLSSTSTTRSTVTFGTPPA